MAFESTHSQNDHSQSEAAPDRIRNQHGELNSISLLSVGARFTPEKILPIGFPTIDIGYGDDRTRDSLKNARTDSALVAQIPFLPIGPLTPRLDIDRDVANVRQVFSWGKDRLDETLTSLNRVSSEDAAKVLSNHNLKNSFVSHAELQLQTKGVIRVGVIDDGSVSHSRNVIARIYASMPEHLKQHVEVVLYDTTQGRDQPGFNKDEARERAFLAARNDAVNKDIVALSVSGGLEPIGLQKLARSIGASDLNANNRNQAFSAALEHFSYDPRIRREMLAVKEAASTIPVLTPILNDGNTSAAALAGNVIVTSLRGDTRATQSSLPDYYLNPLPGNTFSSQGPPRMIGAMLGLVRPQR
jgi:hypothetical protein